MEDSIFTKIINGEIPSHKVYEDESTLVFMDIYAKNEGHVLAIPKAQVEFVWDLPEADYQALMATVKKVGVRIREVMGSKYVHMGVVGVDIPHAHVHLIPFDDEDELRHDPSESQPEPDHEALAALAAKLRF